MTFKSKLQTKLENFIDHGTIEMLTPLIEELVAQVDELKRERRKDKNRTQ
jgi:hypothetical protein